MKTQLTTLKRLTLAGALAATMSFGLLGGQPVGTAFADGLPIPTDLPVQVIEPALGAGGESPADAMQASESLTTDATQASGSLAPDGGAIVQSVFGR